MYSERTVAKLNEIAYRYQDLVQRSLSSVLNQPQYRNTGAGAASVTVDVVEGNASKSPELQINFDDHILLMDKRKLQWTKLPDIKKLMEWASTKKSNPGEAKKLAWAVAWDKKKTDKWKAKPWRKKSLSNVLKEMNKMLLQEFDAAIDEDITEAIKRAQ